MQGDSGFTATPAVKAEPGLSAGVSSGAGQPAPIFVQASCNVGSMPPVHPVQ